MSSPAALAGSGSAGASPVRILIESLAAVAALLVVLAVLDTPERTLFWRTLFDAGHAPLFGVIAVQARRALRAVRGDAPRRSWEAFLLAAALGVATELVQTRQEGRDASFGDLARDVAGAAAFLLAYYAWRHPPYDATARRRRKRLWALAVAGALLGLVAVPMARASAVYTARGRALPTLFRLDGSWWERELVRPANARVMAATGDGAGPPGPDRAMATVELLPGRYPGISFREPHPDWTKYRQLAIPIDAVAGAPFRLTVRIHDAHHDHAYSDRFNQVVLVRPGEQRIVVPLDRVRRAPRRREMDMTRIRSIVLFATELERPVRFRLGPIVLE